ncbi:hypothetical protein [Rhizobium sp. FKL33]|uniref:hypothetical protein n=1 Tax=Rhizobium sp. FKL33 TaxID=2562307 RepID=UPI0010C0CF38|nr:hypothetical protein [Rhizobium sp. FKL33]
MPNVQLDTFTALSVALTGFSAFHLRGTGLVEIYARHLADRIGADAFDRLLETFAGIDAIADAGERKRAIRHSMLSDPCLGPPVRSLLKLWYVGVWHALPPEWHDRFGGALDDVDTVPCAASYTEGLLWPAIGTNPAGVKAQGYAMWARPPRIPNPNQEI